MAPGVTIKFNRLICIGYLYGVQRKYASFSQTCTAEKGLAPDLREVETIGQLTMKRNKKRDRTQHRGSRDSNHKEIKMQQDAKRAFLPGERPHGDEVIEERDELDELFEQLPQIQPPPQLIQKILKSVRQLPNSSSHKPAEPKAIIERDALEGPVKRNEHLPPS